ncbi:hypothetical protein V2J09_023661 [Rumex salicifolius]
MTSHHFLQIFITITLSVSMASTSAATDDEIWILQSIKKAISDPMDHLKDWQFPPNQTDSESPPQHCSWKAISCNSDGFIDAVNLSNMNLNGSISQSLTNLTSLISLDLSFNNFVGPFPIGLGANARSLVYINASSNDFVGPIPDDIGHVASLQTLDLRGSFFEGPVPKSFKNLKNLRFLGLSGNNLTGQIPAELGELSLLETMILGYNEFEGEIPAEFGNLSSLQYLDLAVGSLSGQIPKDLGRLRNLTTVYLYNNRLGGMIPEEFGNVTSLLYLDLSYNQIAGEIPKDLGKLKNLQLLNLMFNQLTGSVPTELGELPNLEVLELWKNLLVGPLPLNLGRRSHLQWLDVSSNNLSGEIPPGLCDSGNLTKLILFNNSFSGPIPFGLANCSSLVRVRIQNNLISGNIPLGLGTLPQLQRLELENNNLSGEIPMDFSQSTSLSFVDLSQNHLNGSLPTGLLSVPSLQTFMASNNRLNGHIPNQFQDGPSLSVINLSYNNLSGQIPESIASCEKLVTLNLRGNQLTGNIPISLARMPTLAVLNLANNSLTGHIPENFGSSPALETLNLSYNKLEGAVPTTGLFATINPNELAGNPGLCGGTLTPCSQDNKALGGRNLHVKHILVGLLVGLLAILVLGLTLVTVTLVYRKWYLYSNSVGDWFKRSNKEWPWRLVAFQRLDFTSANILGCVNESNVIGMGGSGIVYKAEMQRPHAVVAVKKLWRSYRGDEETREEDLLDEVNLLGRLRHRNIVRVLGYLHNENDVMMVYEYMPNGSLWSALHGKEAGTVLVDWVSRYNVAVGIVQGLAYLHHDCHPPIIHRDVKSNNILLDVNFEARIADFGLAKTMLQKSKTVSIVAGTYGYIAPEYGYAPKIDEKSDIYSFGVVLLELITGKMPVDPSFGEPIDVVEWVGRKIRGNGGLKEALDQSLAGESKLVQEEMLLALRIAVLCTAKLPKDRPCTRDVLTMLREAKPRRKSVCNNGHKAHTERSEKPVFSNTPPETAFYAFEIQTL